MRREITLGSNAVTKAGFKDLLFCSCFGMFFNNVVCLNLCFIFKCDTVRSVQGQQIKIRLLANSHLQLIIV